MRSSMYKGSWRGGKSRIMQKPDSLKSTRLSLRHAWVHFLVQRSLPNGSFSIEPKCWSNSQHLPITGDHLLALLYDSL